MRSTGAGKDDGDSGCPKCRRFIQDAEMVAFRVDAIQLRLKEIEKFLVDNEWVFLENAGLMSKVTDIRDVDTDSFDLTCKQIIRFNRYLDKVGRILKDIGYESDNFCRDEENDQK
jgi:hypothetical protein